MYKILFHTYSISQNRIKINIVPGNQLGAFISAMNCRGFSLDSPKKARIFDTSLEKRRKNTRYKTVSTQEKLYQRYPHLSTYFANFLHLFNPRPTRSRKQSSPLPYGPFATMEQSHSRLSLPNNCSYLLLKSDKVLPESLDLLYAAMRS